MRLLPALAAAVVTGMRSMPAAFVAGTLIGVVDQVVAWNVERRATTYVVLLLIVVVGLLVQPKDTSRARAAGESSWSLTGGGRRLPASLAKLPEVRALKSLVALLVLGVLVVIPVVGSPSQVNTATLAVTFALTALSLVVLTGWGGVVSLGQVALIVAIDDIGGGFGLLVPVHAHIERRIVTERKAALRVVKLHR